MVLNGSQLPIDDQNEPFWKPLRFEVSVKTYFYGMGLMVLKLHLKTKTEAFS